LEKIPLTNGDCPATFVKYNIPCRCPISANTWTVSDLVVAITESIPSELQGNYKAQVTLENGSGDQTSCIALEISVQ
jgi:hypothetical protein